MAAARLPATRGPGSYRNDGADPRSGQRLTPLTGALLFVRGMTEWAQTLEANAVRALRASVAAAESGPVIVLSGEADIASAAQLTALIGGQLNAGAVHLTINASGLSYADSMAVQVLVVAAKILRARGGGLVLFRPQRPVARMLTLMAADQLITIRRALEVAPQPGSDAELVPGRRGPEPVVRRTGRTGSIDLRI